MIKVNLSRADQLSQKAVDGLSAGARLLKEQVDGFIERTRERKQQTTNVRQY